MSRVEEYRKKLQQHTQEKHAQAKLFDVKALAADTRQIYSLQDPDLGTIRYGILSVKEVKTLDLTKAISDEEKADLIVYAMLAKADPELCFEDYEALPFHLKALLLDRMSGVFAGFLPRQQPPGSTAVVKRS